MSPPDQDAPIDDAGAADAIGDAAPTDSPIAPLREIELKLDLDRTALDALRGHAAFAAALAKAKAPRRLLATYFDTPDGRLAAQGASLRIRREGRVRVQTLKIGSRAAAGLFDRDEWEVRVAGDTLDFDALAATPLAKLFAKRKVRAALAPLYAVETRRRILSLDESGAQARLVLDEGTVRVGERSEPFCEIELELVQGTHADLFRIARGLAEAAPLSLGTRSKAQRGAALAAGEGPRIVKQVPPGLTPAMSAGEAFQAIARACLKQLAGNEATLREQRAPGAVHQSRVALRRLRAALSLFAPILEEGPRRALSAELKWMADQLGAARDLDVVIATVVEPMRAGDPEDPALVRLSEAFAARREEAFARALAASSSARYRLMQIDAAAFVEAGNWREGANATRDEPVARFARRSLRKRAAKVLAGLGCTPAAKPGRRDTLAEPIGKGAARRALAALSIEARHDLRIAVKKLRYATEFFAGIFVGGEAGDLSAKAAGARHEATLDALEALQEDLGALNDLAVGDRLAASFPEPDPLLAEGLARLARPDAEDAAAEHLAAAAKAVKRLASAKPFWA